MIRKQKKQEISTNKALALVYSLLLKDYALSGATITENKGIYLHEDETVVIENTLNITLLDITEHTVDNIIIDLKSILNQESILKEKTLIEFSFA